MEAAEKISVGVIKEKTKSKAVKKEAEGMRVSTREKVCYGVGDIGANLVWTTVASFLPEKKSWSLQGEQPMLFSNAYSSSSSAPPQRFQFLRKK